MIRKFAVFIVLTYTCLMSNGAKSQQHIFMVDTTVTLVDATVSPYNMVQPGDTLLFAGGQRSLLRIMNFTGEKERPIIFMNSGGQIIIDTDHYYGISILNCRFFRLTGTGDANHFYGIRVSRVANGAGLGIGGMSSDYEIDHVSIENCKSAGIFAKTDPDCSFTSTRENFTQYNTLIHDNYIGHAGTEGLYIGSTQYFGQTVKCNGVDTLLLPSLLEGVKVYNNIIEYSGWDGIQVSSASAECQVFDNIVLFDSQEEYYGQMSGIIIGGGSKCDCNNNFISQGKGQGIQVFGLAGQRIFNNIIIDAGKYFFPTDTTRRVYGIFVSDISAEADSSFTIVFNTILSPKTDGIRFVSIVTKNNLIASNAIINPGAYDYYENGNTSYTGNDAYIMLPDPNSDVLIKNNYLARNSDSAKFAPDGYSLLEGSPLINAAWVDGNTITYDYFNNARPYGASADIGAVEFDPSVAGTSGQLTGNPDIFPNPVNTWLTIQYKTKSSSEVYMRIYTIAGVLVLDEKHLPADYGLQSMQINVSGLATGIYIYTFRSGNQTITGKFIKQN
jgi:hypothetical protein